MLEQTPARNKAKRHHTSHSSVNYHKSSQSSNYFQEVKYFRNILTYDWNHGLCNCLLSKIVSPYVKEPRWLSGSRSPPVDSGSRIVHPGSQVVDSGFQTDGLRRNGTWIPSKSVNSGFHTVYTGFRIPRSGFRIPKPHIFWIPEPGFLHLRQIISFLSVKKLEPYLDRSFRGSTSSEFPQESTPYLYPEMLPCLSLNIRFCSWQCLCHNIHPNEFLLTIGYVFIHSRIRSWRRIIKHFIQLDLELIWFVFITLFTIFITIYYKINITKTA